MALRRSFTAQGGLTITWVPSRGAKFVSLRDQHGREWLSQTTRPNVGPGRSFGQAEMAGWDECAPTIDACTVQGRELPDHGDLWDVAWSEDGNRTSVNGTSWPYSLERTVEQSPFGGIRLSYVARAAGDRVPFLWAAHPQFVAPAGSYVQLGGGITRVVDILAESQPPLPWTSALASFDSVAPGGFRKVYVDPSMIATSATLVRPEGVSLRMRWSNDVRYLGLWFDHAAYAAQAVVAIEPALGFADSLAKAVSNGAAAILQREEPLRWWVDIDVIETSNAGG
ncbi:hypothetical protein [Lacisediminihabitans changchengi]|uniref:Galactose mutarotase n=1 Tax=Lacisediminihabitans changchengi TaxID=2787634 RepID=A0A934SNG0_9MICO|nr:hypothetical protein [Lacisediminihabitans changchengi]MBK4348641.1 hypothetical protein [Lacisediminihabitans changchengi]